MKAYLLKQNRRKVLASIIILVVIIALFISVVVYQTTKSDSRRALENADFFVDNFDIINATSSAILIEFRLNISNFEEGGDSSLVEGESLDLILLNNSVSLAEITIPLDGGGFEESQFIQTQIPIDEEEDNPVLLNFINNLLSGNNFYLDFKGKLHFSVATIFRDSIEFDNNVLFIVNQSSLDLEILEIILPNINSSFANLNLQISNPFSTTFSVTGIIDTIIGDFDLGEIILNEPFVIISGRANYSVKWDLAEIPQIVIGELLKRFNSSIILATQLNLQINDLSISVSPTLKLLFAGSLIDFNIVEVTNFEIDSSDQTIKAEFEIELISNMPIELNITSIQMDITTVSNDAIGSLNWTASDPVSVQPYSSVTIENVSIEFTDISASSLFEIALTRAIKIPYVLISLQFFSEIIKIEFQLDRIDL